jgi:hypothetical protein
VYKQLAYSLSQLGQGLFDLGSIREIVSLSIPAPFSRFPSWLRVSYLVGGSLLNQQFLGHYDSLIDPDSAIPLPTWKGIEWILEDYGLSRHEEKILGSYLSTRTRFNLEPRSPCISEV